MHPDAQGNYPKCRALGAGYWNTKWKESSVDNSMEPKLARQRLGMKRDSKGLR